MRFDRKTGEPKLNKTEHNQLHASLGILRLLAAFDESAKQAAELVSELARKYEPPAV
jgi:hypothetical protein